MYQYRKTRFSKHLDFLISDIFAFELSLFFFLNAAVNFCGERRFSAC